MRRLVSILALLLASGAVVALSMVLWCPEAGCCVSSDAVEISRGCPMTDCGNSLEASPSLDGVASSLPHFGASAAVAESPRDGGAVPHDARYTDVVGDDSSPPPGTKRLALLSVWIV